MPWLELDFKYNLLLFLLLRPERERLKSGPEAPILSFNSQLVWGFFFFFIRRTCHGLKASRANEGAPPEDPLPRGEKGTNPETTLWLTFPAAHCCTSATYYRVHGAVWLKLSSE